MSGKAVTPAPGKLMAASTPMRPSDGGARRDTDSGFSLGETLKPSAQPPQSTRTPATFVPVALGEPIKTPAQPIIATLPETPTPPAITVTSALPEAAAPPPAKRALEEGAPPAAEDES
jgi:hypothetical protein